jgi:hypothetical protein
MVSSCKSLLLLPHVTPLTYGRTAGSSSLLSNTNGGSSGVISPTVGQYGSVTVGFRFTHWGDMFSRQIYSVTRVAGLMGAILSLIGLDVTTPLNCQVGAVFLI